MIGDPLGEVLILLVAAVLVVTAARRAGLPAILGYLLVGVLLGPHAFGLFAESATTRLLSELGVVFLLFTLGLEFSWPRMMAMRREVFGIGSAQVALTVLVVSIVFLSVGVATLPAIALGGAIAVSSTAIILQQLTEQSELNRTHGRMAFSVLLFQDLAFVPFLVLAGALASGRTDFSPQAISVGVGGAILAVAVVLAAGRFLLRPLLYQIAHSRLRELFTLAVLMVALGAAWVSHGAGVSMATGAFLAGMMLAETEYRHQVESVIRPFRDILLGLFFISVGMMLDVRVLRDEFWVILAVLAAMLLLKTGIMALIARLSGLPSFKAVRTGIVLSSGGEFGIAILTILMQGRVVDPSITQPVLVAIVLSMVTAPLILRENRRIVRWLLREVGPATSKALEVTPEEKLAHDLASREHVIICGFGRVGQNLARVLDSQALEYLAMDLDPLRVRSARAAGLPVIYGDASDVDLLREVGLKTANAVVITFADPAVAIGILRAVRSLRADVPVLVRTADDSRLADLMAAGATEVVPETFETSLMLASHALMLLNQPVSRVVRTIGNIRSDRYASLRGLLRGESDLPDEETEANSASIRTVVIPPGAWAVDQSLAEVLSHGVEVHFRSVLRHGVVGNEPDLALRLRVGDEIVCAGSPEALEHAEKVLLAG